MNKALECLSMLKKIMMLIYGGQVQIPSVQVTFKKAEKVEKAEETQSELGI